MKLLLLLSQRFFFKEKMLSLSTTAKTVSCGFLKLFRVDFLSNCLRVIINRDNWMMLKMEWILLFETVSSFTEKLATTNVTIGLKVCQFGGRWYKDD